jgi:hypothetical protein
MKVGDVIYIKYSHYSYQTINGRFVWLFGAEEVGGGEGSEEAHEHTD